MTRLIGFALIALLGAVGCNDDGIDSDEEARRAYLGLDESIGKSLQLGFDGFNTATSANISPQMTAGIETGSLVITGQVDQGSSDNKGMRLRVGMVDYSDGLVVINEEEETISITYDTDADVTLQPALTLTLRNYPNGTLEGTLIGTYFMTGDLEGEASLNLTFSGTTMDNGTGGVIRVPGNTTVTGTASTGDGSYDVDLTL